MASADHMHETVRFPACSDRSVRCSTAYSAYSTAHSAAKSRVAFGVSLGALALLVGSVSLFACTSSSQAAAQPVAPTQPSPSDTSTTVFGQVAPPLATPAVIGTPDIATLVEKVQPAVVNITTRSTPTTMQMIDPFEFFFGPGLNPFGIPRQSPQTPSEPRGQQSLGSGFVIDAEGYVVTNSHVIENADKVMVRFADDKQYDAKVVGRDSRLDVALLQLQNAPKLTPVVMGDSDKLRVGEYVVAVGNPFGLGHTVTMGIVSAKDRTIGAGPYDDFIQTDASINPGNSGGPLFNLRGELVGINTAIHRQGQGIGFAIPINLVRNSILQLKQHGHVTRGKLGLVFQPVTDEIARAMKLDNANGALVAEVQSSGAAERAGIQSGDLITHVNGVEVQRSNDLPRMIAVLRPGTAVELTLLRAGKQRKITVILEALEPDENDVKADENRQMKETTRFGIAMQRRPDGSVMVTEVSRSMTSKLFVGDVIQAVDGRAVSQPAQVFALLDAAKRAKRPALLQVRRQKATLFVALDLNE